MSNAHIIAGLIGISLALSIIYLVRADHISPKVAARWFFVSLCVLLLGLSPGIVDWLGEQLGIGYPPIIPVLIALAVAMIKILIMDIERQKLENKIERLAQKVAIVESLSSENKNEFKTESKVVRFKEENRN